MSKAIMFCEPRGIRKTHEFELHVHPQISIISRNHPDGREFDNFVLTTVHESFIIHHQS